MGYGKDLKTIKIEHPDVTALGEQLAQNANRYVKALGHTLSSAFEPVCLLVHGDSTSAGKNTWVYPTFQWLATKYPSYTAKYREWDDSKQAYKPPTILQVGLDGEAYCVFNSVFNSLCADDSSAIQLTGDLDVAMKVGLDDWADTANERFLIGKFGSSTTRSWQLGIDASGYLFLWFSSDGTNLKGGVGSYTTSTAKPNVADGQPTWIRFTVDVDNGASGHTIRYYTSQDGEIWTQLGADRVGTGTTSIFTNTDYVEISGRGRGTGFFTGKFYRAWIKNGIDGKVVASPDLGLASPLELKKTFKDVEGTTWTGYRTAATDYVIPYGSKDLIFLNGAVGGTPISYAKDGTRFELMTKIEPMLAFINYSHNEGTTSEYQSSYEGLATQLLTKYPNVGVVCVTQNPEKAPRPINIIQYHTVRNRQIAVLAAKNDYGLIDAYRAFIQTGNPNSYIHEDGTHPNELGYALWSSLAKSFLSGAVDK